MVRVILFFAVLITSFTISKAATDINGKWKGTMHGPNGDMDLVFVFEAKGDSLTGTVQSQMGDIPITNGKIDGNKFSFDVSFNDMTIKHECTVNDDSISMKVAGMGGGEDTEIILKRVEEDK